MFYYTVLAKSSEDSKSTDNDKAKEVIQKAKVEDDEYKNTSEEHTYYRLVIFVYRSLLIDFIFL